jgi:orotate phosphoribosyltransferase
MKSLASIPGTILQPFSLSATALVTAVFLGIFVSALTAIIALVLSVLLLVLGLIGTPREAVGQLVAGDQNYSAVSDIDSDTPVASTRLTKGHGGPLTPLETLCFLHLDVREGGYVGRSRRFNVTYFVDLMSAALVQDHLQIMTAELVNHVKRIADLDRITVLAGPKRGNALLIARTAHNLDLTPMLVKERPLFGKTLEGVDGEPSRAAIIDDISSDGELLAICAELLRENGYEINDAYVLIDRTEGDSTERLADLGITLHPLLRLDDVRLRDIVSRARREAPR